MDDTRPVSLASVLSTTRAGASAGSVLLPVSINGRSAGVCGPGDPIEQLIARTLPGLPGHSPHSLFIAASLLLPLPATPLRAVGREGPLAAPCPFAEAEGAAISPSVDRLTVSLPPPAAPAARRPRLARICTITATLRRAPDLAQDPPNICRVHRSVTGSTRLLPPSLTSSASLRLVLPSSPAPASWSRSCSILFRQERLRLVSTRPLHVRRLLL